MQLCMENTNGMNANATVKCNGGGGGLNKLTLKLHWMHSDLYWAYSTVMQMYADLHDLYCKPPIGCWPGSQLFLASSIHGRIRWPRSGSRRIWQVLPAFLPGTGDPPGVRRMITPWAGLIVVRAYHIDREGGLGGMVQSAEGPDRFLWLADGGDGVHGEALGLADGEGGDEAPEVGGVRVLDEADPLLPWDNAGTVEPTRLRAAEDTGGRG